MAEPVLFDPAIEVLLREIAADPNSCLLRVPRPNIVKSLAHRQSVVRPSATGLSSVERELLRVHRGELAKVLREACVMRLVEHPEAKFELSRHLTATRQTPVMSAPAWRAKAKYTLEVTRTHGASLTGMALLDACVVPDGVESTSVAQLAIASMRLEPTDAGRIYPAIELTLDGQEELALRVLHDVLAGSCSRTYAAHAWTHVGLAYAGRGDASASLAAYERANALDQTRIAPLLSLLGVACDSGADVEIGRFAKRVDEQLDSSHAAVGEYAFGLRARRAQGLIVIPPNRVVLLQVAKDRAGPTARMVIDALV